MRKKLFYFVSFIFFTGGLVAQFPNLNTFKKSLWAPTHFSYPCSDWENVFNHCYIEENKMKCEVPPWIVPGGWRQYIMVDGEGSFANSSPQSLLETININIRNNGYGPFDIAHSEKHQQGGNVCPTNNRPWARIYYCAYAVELINHPAAGRVSLAFMSGENRRTCIDVVPGTGQLPFCENSINPGQHWFDCNDYWQSMNAFISLNWIPNTEATNWGNTYFSNEVGPIVWPSNGYLLPSGEKASAGVGNPSPIQWNGYVYMFYRDEGSAGPPEEEGRYEGIRVARAPIGDALNPYAWTVFYRDPATGIETWNPSLPAGFTKENMMDFVRVKGPRSTELFGEYGLNYGHVRFSVAHVKGTNEFIGVESWQANGHEIKSLRLSSDLVHWSGRVMELEVVDNWEQSKLNYPIFLDKTGWSNTEVDANDFFVIGTTGGNINPDVNKMHVYWEAPPTGGGGGPGPCGPGMRCPDDPLRSTKPAGNNTETPLVLPPGISPNPGNGLFNVSYALSGYAKTQLNVLDISGRRIRTGNVQARPAGSYVDNVDITSHANGVYMVELLIDGKRTVYKVVKN